MNRKLSLQEHLDRYTTGRQVITVDLDQVPEGERCPEVVIKHHGFTLTLNPMALGNHLCVDAEGFVEGEAATVGTFGMTNGSRYSLKHSNALPGTTSHGWASTAMVALMVGEQA